MNRASASGLPALLLIALATGCPAKYPKCSQDKDCHAKEYCVHEQCQQCRNDGDCASGQKCNSGRCEAPRRSRWRAPTTAQCPAGQSCIGGACTACASRRRSAAKAASATPAAARAAGPTTATRGADARQRLHAGAGLLRLQRVRAHDRGDRRHRHDADCIKKGGQARHADRPHRSARHRGVQPGADATSGRSRSKIGWARMGVDGGA